MMHHHLPARPPILPAVTVEPRVCPFQCPASSPKECFYLVHQPFERSIWCIKRLVLQDSAYQPPLFVGSSRCDLQDVANSYWMADVFQCNRVESVLYQEVTEDGVSAGDQYTFPTLSGKLTMDQGRSDRSDHQLQVYLDCRELTAPIDPTPPFSTSSTMVAIVSSMMG